LKKDYTTVRANFQEMSKRETRGEAGRAGRRRRSDGERSRTAILREAAQLATVEGLDGLSINRLAEAVGMSKSGLFAHFGSKEELQLATVETARTLFDEIVIGPSLAAATGLDRLRLLAESYLRHVEESVFPGGCFFASVAAELDTHPGPVRDLALAVIADWQGRLEAAIREAQAEGAIDPAEDAGQLMFEIQSYLLLANALFVITQESAPMVRARRAIERRLAQATTVAREQ
jgi:AcrR family transcriptional regulator